MDDLTKVDGVVCGATGANTNPVFFPKIINQLIGSNIRVVSGYQGAAAIALAMARGEVNCMGSHSWSAAKATLGQYLSEGKMSVLVQWGPAKDPDISDHAKHDVPLIVDYAHIEHFHRPAVAGAAGCSPRASRCLATGLR
jgi:hypothetical protein